MGAAGVVLLLFGAAVLAWRGGEPPDRTRLTQVTGQLRSLGKIASKGGGLGAVRFSLAGDPRDFHYISKAGQIDRVWSALGRAGHSDVGVLVDPADSHSPPLDGRVFHTVFEVRVGQETIRPYDQVVASWGTDEFIGAGLGYGSVVTGIALLVVDLLRRRQLGPSRQ
jgi:hypothetical protein